MTHPDFSLSPSLLFHYFPRHSRPCFSISSAFVRHHLMTPLPLLTHSTTPFVPPSLMPPLTSPASLPISSSRLLRPFIPGCCDGWCVVGWVQFGCGKRCCSLWPLRSRASCWGSSSTRGIWHNLFNLDFKQV